MWNNSIHEIIPTRCVLLALFVGHWVLRTVATERRLENNLTLTQCSYSEDKDMLEVLHAGA